VTLNNTEFTASGLFNGDAIAGVTLTSTGAVATATVSGSPYAIVPSAAAGTGLGNYAISYVNGSLSVKPAALTITADSTSKTYGQTVTFGGTDFTESGLVNGDSITGVTLTSSGTVATATVSGSPYAIVPSAAAGTGLSNYTISYASGSLTIHSAALTITADSTSKTYGQTATITNTGFTASGLVNGDNITGVSLTSSGAAASARVAGSPYTIVPSNAVGTGLDNYAVTYTAGMLTINPAPLTVVADSDSISFGGSVPALTASFIGFVNGDTPASLTTPPELATLATSNSPAGTYAITVGGAGSPDYTISYRGGNLTVDPYSPPAQSRYRAAAAFVNTLYAKLGGGPPEPVPFMFWMRKYLGHQSPMNITRAFARSISAAISGNGGSAPKVSLRVACNDAQAAARRAGR
jgi:MBG domain (YGX type)